MLLLGILPFVRTGDCYLLDQKESHRILEPIRKKKTKLSKDTVRSWVRVRTELDAILCSGVDFRREKRWKRVERIHSSGMAVISKTFVAAHKYSSSLYMRIIPKVNRERKRETQTANNPPKNTTEEDCVRLRGTGPFRSKYSTFHLQLCSWKFLYGKRVYTGYAHSFFSLTILDETRLFFLSSFFPLGKSTWFVFQKCLVSSQLRSARDFIAAYCAGFVSRVVVAATMSGCSYAFANAQFIILYFTTRYNLPAHPCHSNLLALLVAFFGHFFFWFPHSLPGCKTANADEALAQALNLAVNRMASRLEVMENTATELIDRARGLQSLAENLEGQAVTVDPSSPPQAKLRKASAVTVNTDGIGWKKFEKVTEVDHAPLVRASPTDGN